MAAVLKGVAKAVTDETFKDDLMYGGDVFQEAAVDVKTYRARQAVEEN